MIDISLNKIYKTFGFKPVLEEVSLEIKTGDRIGLVGSNGCGKSTLLKLISGEENVTSGSIAIRKNIKIGYLKQVLENRDEDFLVKDVLYESIKDVLDIEKKMHELEEQMQDSDKLETILRKYANLQNKFMEMNGYGISEKVGRIVSGFQIERLLEMNYNNLSGGEKRIVELARIMINNPDVLLLDEPTNHLDIITLEWFEKYLNNYEGTVLVVSHDRYFLDKVVNKIVLIERGANEIFHGNYSYYLKENEARILREFESYKNQQKQIEMMKSQAKKLREWGKKGNNERFFRRAICIERRIAKMNLVEKPIEEKELPLCFKIDNRSGNDVLVVSNYSLVFPNKELLNDVSFKISFGEKVCLIGNNGSGKSSLVKEIIKNNNKNIIIGSNVRIGYIPQIIEFDNDEMNVLEFARKVIKKDETHVRADLFNFSFWGDSIEKRLKNLSGGEKVKLKLLELVNSNCNLLILDEPTNHIDIATREVLEEALRSFKGTVLFICHDRYFINQVSSRILAIEDKKINSYVGDYDYYREHIIFTNNRN